VLEPNAIKKRTTSLVQLRNQLLNVLIISLAITAVPSLAISVYRASIIGFQGFMLVQIFLVCAMLITWVLRDSVSYHIRVTILLCVLWIATFAALSKLGPVSDSKVFMVIFSLVAILFLPPKKAWMAVLFIILSMAGFGVLAVKGFFTFELDFAAYSQHPLPWILTTWNMGIFSALIGYLTRTMLGVIIEKSTLANEASDKHNKIANRIPGMVYQYRMRPNRTYYFPYVSEGIRDIFQIEPEAVRDDASVIMERIHPDDIKAVQNSIIRSAKFLEPWVQEYRIIDLKGQIHWLSGSSSPELESDGGVLWHGIIMDITDKKSADNIKSEFVSTVSHELRTPLTAINGSLKLINNGVLAPEDKKYTSIMRMAERNAEKLLTLINDLLDIEKLESGKFQIDKVEIDLQEFVESIIEMNQSFAYQYQTSIELVESTQAVFFGDKVRLNQVFTNLISNACKYSPPGKPVEVGCRVETGRLSIFVRDHGEGIPEKFIDNLFEKFTQADSSTTRKVGGTGLGLSIVKKIVDLHGGHILVENRLGKGACFTVELPLI
jgi:signal transduction histidine kinase